jgi:hypothetical protein
MWEGSGRGLFPSAIPKFPGRDWGKPTTVRSSESRTRHPAQTFPVARCRTVLTVQPRACRQTLRSDPKSRKSSCEVTTPPAGIATPASLIDFCVRIETGCDVLQYNMQTLVATEKKNHENVGNSSCPWVCEGETCRDQFVTDSECTVLVATDKALLWRTIG